MDNPGLQPPITPPPVTPPAPPPVPPISEPPKEEPIIQPPSNPTVKKAKKFLPKLAVGALVMVLLVGGLLLGKNLLLQKQRPVEKQASYLCDMCMKDCLERRPGEQSWCEGICHASCGDGGDGDGDGGCDTSSTTAAECRGKAVGYVIDSSWTGSCGPCPNGDECPTGWSCSSGYCDHSSGSTTLVCRQTTGTLCAAVCEGGGGGGDGDDDVCGDGCVKYVCPYGDTDSNGKCDERDCGVSWNFYGGNGCPDISCGSDCCQIDYTLDQTYCTPPDHKEISWNCTVLPGPCNPPSSPNPSPSASPPTSPPPSAPPTVACVDLTKDKTAPSLGDQVTFTCEASLSSNAPIAFFRTSSDNGVTYSGNIPYAGVPVNSTTNKANQVITIDKTGNWIVQCRICDSTATTCTTWGQAQ